MGFFFALECPGVERAGQEVRVTHHRHMEGYRCRNPHDHELLPRFDRSIDVMDLLTISEKPQIAADEKAGSPQITQINTDKRGEG